jgi:hypothetical protein
MHLTILAVPDCPNAPVLEDRLAAVVRDRESVSMTREVISDAGQAARRGMHGSPTLLIDEADPFAEPGKPGEPGRQTSLSCRLYRDEHGRPSGAPSAEQLRRAIHQAASGDTQEPA